MNAIDIPPPPVTKHEITAPEFINTAKGGYKQTDWFYRKSGLELKNAGTFPALDLDEDLMYIVVIGCRCLPGGPSGGPLLLPGLDERHSTGFIFIESIFPGFILQGCNTAEWIFINTHMDRGIEIDKNSHIGKITIEKNSWCDQVMIDKASSSEGIIVQENSVLGDIQVHKESKCGTILIRNSSSGKRIRINDSSYCTSVAVRDKSSINDIELSDKSEMGNIRLSGECNAIEIRILNNSKCKEIRTEYESQCRDIFIEGDSESDAIWAYRNSQYRAIRIVNGSKCKNIRIWEESEIEFVTLDGASHCRDVFITKDSRSGPIYFGKGSKSNGIEISYKSRCERVHLEDESQSEFIRITNKGQCEEIRIDNSKIEYIEVVKDSLTGPILIYSNSQLEALRINEESQSGNIEIDQGRVNRVEMSHNCCSILLRSAMVSVMQINHCHLHKLFWQAGTKAEFYIANCVINHLCLNKTALLKDAVFSIISSKICIIQLQELLVQGLLIFRNIETSPAPFTWFSPISKPEKIGRQDNAERKKMVYLIENDRERLLWLQDRQYDRELKKLMDDPALCNHIIPLFRIVNSSLGKMEITGSDLTGFNFEYRDSRLLEVFINGTKLPKEKIDIYNERPLLRLEDKVYFEQKISIYNQLRKIFENQGDIVEATWYHSKAMANQERLLSFLYNEKPSKWWSEEAFDLFNFRLNKISNNHGESWRRALCFSLIILLSIYTLYFMSANWGKSFAWSGTWDFIGNFFSFLDITHKIDFMVDKDKLNWVAKFLDFFGRVATGYCIYQFIAAFRRHGKKT